MESKNAERRKEGKRKRKGGNKECRILGNEEIRKRNELKGGYAEQRKGRMLKKWKDTALKCFHIFYVIRMCNSQNKDAKLYTNCTPCIYFYLARL